MIKSKKILAILMAVGLTAAACGSTVDDAADEVNEITDETIAEADEAVLGDDDVSGEVGVEDETGDADVTDDELAEDVDEMTDDEMDEDADDASDDESSDEEPATVVDIATASGDFSTLVAALTEADLVETLQGDGPFTVFAPSNEAFDAFLTDNNLNAEDLLAVSDLADILTYHVVAGEIDAEAAIAADGTSVETVNGESIDVTVVDGEVVLDGVATVVTPDIMAGNGIVHVIDYVLAP